MPTKFSVIDKLAIALELMDDTALTLYVRITKYCESTGKDWHNLTEEDLKEMFAYELYLLNKQSKCRDMPVDSNP